MRRLIVIMLALLLISNEPVSAQDSVSARQRVCLVTTMSITRDASCAVIMQKFYGKEESRNSEETKKH